MGAHTLPAAGRLRQQRRELRRQRARRAAVGEELAGQRQRGRRVAAAAQQPQLVQAGGVAGVQALQLLQLAGLGSAALLQALQQALRCTGLAGAQLELAQQQQRLRFAGVHREDLGQHEPHVVGPVERLPQPRVAQQFVDGHAVGGQRGAGQQRCGQRGLHGGKHPQAAGAGHASQAGSRLPSVSKR